MSNVKRRDFAFLFKEHIDNNGGIEAVLDQLPSDPRYTARGFIEEVYKAAVETNHVTYKQYFGAVGTLFHYEVLGCD